MYQYRKNQLAYRKHNKSDKATVDCTLCENIDRTKIVRETEHTIVVPNRVSYDVWEHHNVTDHLLVIPKRHVRSLNDLSDEELLDAMKICAEFEAKEYNVYARASHSIRRSVVHQHTHLIKIDAKEPRASLLVRKPYFLIKF